MSAARCACGICASLRSVMIAPGAMQFTRMPSGPTCVARCCVSICTPALAAAYGTGDIGEARRRRRDRDDVAAAPLFHAGQEALDSQKRAREVELDRCAPALQRDLFDRTGRRDAGSRIRDEDIDRAEHALDRCAHVFKVLVARDVTAYFGGGTPGALDILPNACERLGVSTMENDACTLAGKPTRDCRADPARASCHECDLLCHHSASSLVWA